ncbi:MAG: TatD family hydrolase [Sumerlaeia bacterium]
MLPLFDSHAHLQSAKFGADRQRILALADAIGVQRVLNLATRLEDAGDVLRIGREVPADWSLRCLTAVGVHPSDEATWDDATEAGLRELAQDPDVVVWGEIGLDYYWPVEDRERMRRVFRRQLAIARELGLPVSIHSRGEGCYDDVIADLKSERGAEVGGVAHCYVGTAEQARELLDMGFYFGVGGIATYPKNTGEREVLRVIGADRLIVETDAPYLSPQPRRGRRNEPSYTAFTARSLAETLGLTEDDLAARTWKNTVAAFRLGDEHAMRGCWARGEGLRVAVSCPADPGSPVPVEDLLAAIDRADDETGGALGAAVFEAAGRPLAHLETTRAAARRLKEKGRPVILETDGLADARAGEAVELTALGDCVDEIRVPFTGPDKAVFDAVHYPVDMDGAFEAVIAFLDRVRESSLPLTIRALALEGVDLGPVRQMAARMNARLEVRETQGSDVPA